MGLVPEDYQIFKKLNMIDNEGNQKVDFHNDYGEEEPHQENEEFDDVI